MSTNIVDHHRRVAAVRATTGDTRDRRRRWLRRQTDQRAGKGGRWAFSAEDVDRLVAAHVKADDPYHLAIIYSGLRDKERTFESLNRAADRADHRAPAFLFSPETEFLRGDPRLDDLKRKLKLPIER